MNRRLGRAVPLMAACALAGLWPVGGGTAAGAAPAPAGPRQAPPTVALRGHGWGHGVGMGQWGALGYALAGQSYSWILDHYYGGTSAGTVADGPIRVRIVENDGNDVIVTSGSAFTVAGTAFAPGQAALMHLTSTPGTWTVSQGPGCAGPWTQVGAASDSGGAGPQAVATPSVSDPTAGAGQVLQLCQGGGNLYLRGSIQGAEIGGVARTVNVLPIEQYLRGVVPSESPASWGTLGAAGAQGQPQGFQALEAQAVAARSYAAAEEAAPSSQGGTGAYGYADICDTTACQVYGGMKAEDAVSDQAVAGTAGQVRTDPSGAVNATEYSSSTGGWTAGGPYPAVVDDGDAVCVTGACNPNHTWTVDVPVSSIESAYPSIGAFQSMQVTARTGPAQADEGGRVSSLTLQGSTGTATTTGATFAAALGLRSSWFAVLGTPSGGFDGYWVGAADGGVFSFGSAAFHGSTGGMRLNKPVVGMAATPDGNGYWLVASDGGIFTFGDAAFHGSTGGTRISAPVVGMAATPDGAGYWLVGSDGGLHAFGDAQTFPPVGSGARGPVSGLAPTADGRGYWLLERGGTVDAFGDASPLGSVTGSAAPAVAIQATPDARGYLVVTTAGGVYAFGDAPAYGSVGDQVPGYPGRALAVAGHPGS